MKAVAYTTSLPIEDQAALIDTTLPDPAPGPHDLLVEVRAVSVNPVDYKVRKRSDPQGVPKVLGFDAAGVVRAVGAEVTLFRPGDEVFYAGDITRPGTNSELHLVDQRIVGPKPRTLDFAQAAALPLTAITAWEALFDRIRMPKDAPTTLLVIGGAGGVGSIAIQLARQLTQARVIATASRPATVAWVRELGAHDAVDHRGDLAAQVRALGVPGVPFIFSTTHTDQHWPAIVALVAPQGALVLIDDPGPIDVRDLKRKAASLHWELMFTRPMFATGDMIGQHRLLAEVARLVDAGRIRTTLAEHFGAITAANLRRAHAKLEAGTARGKIVLEGWG
jgi:zinc-binding alcohol dehydrogenase family protein